MTAQAKAPPPPAVTWPLGAAVPAGQRPAGLQCNSTGLWHVVLRFDYNQPAHTAFVRQAVERMALVDASTGWRIVSLEHPHNVIEVFAVRSGWPAAAANADSASARPDAVAAATPATAARHPFDALPGLDAPVFANPMAFDTVQALRRELERANAELLRSEQRQHALRQTLADIGLDIAPVALAFMRADAQAMQNALYKLMALHMRAGPATASPQEPRTE